MAQLSFKYSMFSGSGSGSDGLMLEPLHHHHHHHHCKLLRAFDRFQYAAYLSQLAAFGDDRKLLCFSSSLNNNNNNNSEDDVSLSAFDHEIDELSGFRGLVLDLSYRPVNVVCWKRAICLEFMDKADVLEYYDQTINSPSGSFYIPAVLRVPHLLQVVKRRKVKRGLSRKHIFQRDNFTCQYCYSIENLTIDHVLPIARGGKWTWENLVAACAKCNSKKGQKTLEEASMKLIKVPKAPNDYDILAIPLTNHAIKLLKTRKGMPEEWRQYLSKPYAAP